MGGVISLKDKRTAATVFFATSNIHKIEEAKAVLKDYPIIIEQVDAKTWEIQSDDVEEVAKTSAKWIAREKGIPILVEDTGLYVEALNGFPGAYASYVYKTIGRKGVIKLLDIIVDRRAAFRSAAAYCIPDEEPICFLGIISGRISKEERGLHGFAFDSIFEPNDGGGKTFAEMTVDEKNLYSHRAQSIKRFAEWYLKRLHKSSK